MNKKELICVIIFIIVCLAIIVVAISPVLAFNTFKWELCDSANKTGGECDDYWVNFQESLGIDLDNNNNNSVGNLTSYYNKSQIDEKIEKIGNGSDIISQEDLDKWGIEFRDSFSENYVRQDVYDAQRFSTQESNNSDFLQENGLFILIGAVVVVGGLWFYNNKKKQQVLGQQYGTPQAMRPNIQMQQPMFAPQQVQQPVKVEKPIEPIPKKEPPKQPQPQEPQEQGGDVY